MTISIITATFNSASTLRDTLESVLSQTYKDIEYIIKDGGSNDNTLDIIREYEPRFRGRMKWVSAPDHGIYDAMNQGIALATGDVIGILNSDDFYTSNTVLEQVAKALENEELDAVYGDIHYVDHSDLSKCVRYYSSAFFRRGLMRLGFLPAHPSFYCKKAIYDKYGAFNAEFRIAGDFENLLRLIFVHRIRTKYIPVDFVTMRTGGCSTSGLQSHRRIMKEHLRAYKANGVYSNVLLEGLRYLYKVWELIKFKIHN